MREVGITTVSANRRETTNFTSSGIAENKAVASVG
ncbi:hypothetical protein Rleg10DRAFT_6501 [Rhizobium leguminosarum bv. trifolii WSM2012]|nr:hypothetical protein Rleg10DRAFT_6501 [Rhizobium leguminosarum bv. trifolii WSM2012]